MDELQAKLMETLFSQFLEKVPADVNIDTSIDLLDELHARVSNGEFYDEDGSPLANFANDTIVSMMRDIAGGFFNTLAATDTSVFERAVYCFKESVFTYEMAETDELPQAKDALDNIAGLFTEFKNLKHDWAIFSTDMYIASMADRLACIISDLNLTFFYLGNGAVIE